MKKKPVKKTPAKKKSVTKKPVKEDVEDNFPIVAIGASAGGLEAVTELLKNLPNYTGMAFVYVQHLAPSHESLLPEILARETKMNVLEAVHKMKVLPNHVYIIPPDKDMSIDEGMLVLNPRTSRPGVHLPIDKFFISLAERQNESAIGVLLSGNASDGTLGLKAIKAAGGLTFAQDDSARFPGMPKSAIAEGVVDRVLSPKKIAKEIVIISRQAKELTNSFSEKESLHSEGDVNQIIQLISNSLGIDFSHYKITTIKRRIIRRMLLYKIQTLKSYYLYLQQHPNEINVLYQDLLINVTSFFRDPDAMEYIKKTLLPKLLKSKSANNPLRIWVPACSTGEEAYSIAMLMIEVLGEKATSIPVQIFATDLSDLAIAKARLGVYTQTEVAEVSPKRMNRFFTRIDGSFRIAKPIRDLCVFAPHNIFKDPPFSKLDFISCCNLMIYMDSVLQKRIITTFHYALNPGGYLMLGKSETISASPQFFSQLEKKYKIYSRKSEATQISHFEVSPKKTKSSPSDNIPNRRQSTKEHNNGANLDKIVESTLLANYVPASIVITDDLEIVQFRGSTGLFLEPLPGKASLNLLKMAKPGLAFELRNAIYKASKSWQTVRKTGIEMKSKGGIAHVGIEVVPLKSIADERFFLVLFQELTIHTAPAKTSLSRDKLMQKLEAELRNAKEDMHSFIAEQEATNEELQSANEEIVSSNEELQSINEELETSKEEIESTNEELMTINSELQIRNDQLTEAYEYSEAIFEIIREAVLVLNEELRVKFANKAFYKIFDTTEANTVGLHITEIGDRQWNIPELRDLLTNVQERSIKINGFEVQHTFPKLGEKIMKLYARSIIQKNHKQQLVLLAIEDISEHVFGQRIVAEREAWMRNVADSLPVIVWVINAQKACTFLNNTWYDFTGNVQVNLNWEELVHADDLGNFLKTYNLGFNSRNPFTIEFRMRRKDGQYYWMFLSANPNFSTQKEFLGFIGSVTNIQHQKVFTDQLERSVQERTQALTEVNKKLELSNEELRQFAYVASHDLQEPLRKIMTFSDRTIEYFSLHQHDQVPLYLQKIVESSRRMSTLINDLLNFSRSTRMDHEFVMTDLNTLLFDVVRDFDLSNKGTIINLDISRLPVLPAIPVQMRQLFHNLISNAIKFSSNNAEPKITISSRNLKNDEIPVTLDRSRKYAEIKVTDNGIGFDKQFADQIFIIFQRLHDKQTFPGTGIGLALCRKIVSNHYGIIYADSLPNEGASFYIILPINQV